MLVRDVRFKEGYTALSLKGKTGARHVIAVASTSYLMSWLENHPMRDRPEAPLWMNLGTVNRYKAMSYPALAKVLKVAAGRAGLDWRTLDERTTFSYLIRFLELWGVRRAAVKIDPEKLCEAIQGSGV